MNRAKLTLYALTAALLVTAVSESQAAAASRVDDAGSGRAIQVAVAGTSDAVTSQNK
jgi:hypothetical protein